MLKAALPSLWPCPSSFALRNSFLFLVKTQQHHTEFVETMDAAVAAGHLSICAPQLLLRYEQARYSVVPVCTQRE